jgi:hypothetical protein
VAKSVAITGSDPYFRTGTDVAVLFETKRPELLENLLLAQIKVGLASSSVALKMEKGESNGIEYYNVRSPDRSVCSYVAQLALVRQ